MGYLLFILSNASLFIRPAEIVPALEALPIYNVLISASLVICAPMLGSQLTARSLVENPISSCVVGLLAAVVLSHLSHGAFGAALGGGIDFFKVVLYYFLLVGVLNTPARFRQFVSLLVGFTAVLTVLALLQYHGMINIPSLESIGDMEVDHETGEEYSVLRLCSTGIYHDPNDLCMILLIAMGICCFGLFGRRSRMARPFLLGLLLLFGYALTKTHSRGGFLALVGSTLVFLVARFGVRKAIPLAMVAVPAALVLFAGRQTDISTSGDTGQDRIQLWAEGLNLFRQSPLFGIGQDRYADAVGLVAHNSFIHAFTELGFFGGTLFAGAFCYAFLALSQLRQHKAQIRDPELRRFGPFLLAIVAAYAIGLLTISRNYIVPTYMVFGLVTAYLKLAIEGSAIRLQRLDGKLVARFVIIGMAFILMAHLFIRSSARFGS